MLKNLNYLPNCNPKNTFSAFAFLVAKLLTMVLEPITNGPKRTAAPMLVPTCEVLAIGK